MNVTYEPLKSVALIRWPIDDFKRALDSREYLDSEHFSLKGLSSKFYLRICFNQHVSYYLYVSDMGTEKKVECTVCLWLENIDGKKCAETTKQTVKFTENEQHPGQLPNFLINLLGIIVGDVLLYSYKAIVCCEVTYQVPDQIFRPSNSDIVFRQKLWDSRENGFCDVTIKVEGKDLKASKVILTANSEVFERMFLTSNCVEAQTGIIEIKDIKASDMESVIKFMYLGKLDDLDSISIDLFKAADKYEIEGLKDLCVEHIVKNLSEETLFDVVVLAYIYKFDSLKNSISEFLAAVPNSKHFIKLMSNRRWIEFAHDNEGLVADIIRDILGNILIKY